MSVLDTLRGGLVVSCQPVDDGPMDLPDIVAAMARAAVAGGARGLRIEGIDNLRAVRPLVRVPVIGIVKRDSATSPVRITPTLADVHALIGAGADIVAYDATPRPRADERERLLEAILQGGVLAMADCSTEDDARHAKAGGVQILGTTLSGYTAETEGRGDAPDLDLVRRLATLGRFVMAEGRYNTPALAAAALGAGADAVTVGSAITRLEHVTGWFSAALDRRSAP
ncbi:MAG: putative N-acetylmannosamine-6-phosphate 2-epimerase [Geminicoccaceae bacterium]|nr:putative N-acetylmannosamine-6-phosphate 2-epimerase [Geminicoccaceae bacterium]